jgi:hypothetical protein
MPTPNRAVCAADPKIQRNSDTVCGGAPFSLTNPSNDVSIFAGQRGTSDLGSSSSFVGTDEPRDHEDDDILGRDERVSLLQPSEAAPGGVPAIPIATAPSIETMTTIGRRFGQSLPPFVEEIESEKKSLTGHARGSKKCGSISRCTKRWTMVLSFLWLCTFIVNVDSFDPGNILIVWFFFDCIHGETLKLTAFKIKIIVYTPLDYFLFGYTPIV